MFEGNGNFASSSKPFGVLTEKQINSKEVLFPPAGRRPLAGAAAIRVIGQESLVQAGDNGIRFLLVSGKPIKEPVAWYSPRSS